MESDRTLAPKPMLVDAIRQLSDVCQAADNLLVDVDRGGTAAAFLIARRELLEKMTSLLDRQRRAAADNNVEELDLYEDLPTPQDGAPYIEFVPCGLRSPNAMLLGKLTVDNDKAGNDLADDDSTRQQKRPRRFSKDDDDKSVFAPFYESGSETGHDDFEELIVFRRRSRTESEKRMDCGVNGVTLAQTECRSTPCTSTTNDDSSCDGDLCLNGFDVKPSISTSDCSDVNDNQNVDRTSRHSVETQTEVAPSPPTPSSHRCCDAAVVSATCGQATSRDGSTSNVECGGVYVSVAADVGTGHTDISASSTRSVTRRVQTDRVVIRDSWTETYSTPTADKSTTCYFSSWNPVTVDRSTMTSIMYRDPRNTRSTSTDWLVITRDQETSTLPPTTLNCGVQVDRPRTRCRMVDVRPETSNKSTCTSQLVVCIDTKSDFGELTKVISAMKSAVRTADAAVGNDIEMTVDSQIAVASNEINQDDISKRDSDSFSESVDGSAKTDRLMPAQTAAEHASTEDYIPEIISFRTQDNDIQSACVDDRLSDSSSECLQDVDVTKLQSDGTSRDDGILTDVSSAQTDIRDDSELSFDSNSVVTTNDSDDTLDFNAVGSSDVIPSTLFLDEKADMVPGLLSRLVALLPEIVRTVDELTSSHSNSGSTAHLLLEVADIAKNLQSSSPQQRHTAGGIDETVSFSAPAPDTEGAQAMIGSGMSASATTVDCAVGNSCVSVCDAAVGSDQPSSAECPSRPDWNQQPTVVDCGVGCSVVTTCDQSTMALTTRPMMFDKETATVHGHMLHKNVGTDSQSKADKQTSTSVCDVASAYLGTVSALTMTRRTITVSRGTCTPPLQQQQQPPLLNRSQSEIVRVDRASSPIPVSRCDKSVSASRAEALEPLDTFQTPSSPLSPRSRRPLALSPRSSKLACINEAASDDDELGTSSAGGRVNSQSGGNASATVLPPMSAISSRLVAARSLNRGVGVSTSTATGGGVRCGVNSLQRPTLGRHRPNLPGSPLRIPLIAAIPPLNRSVFDFENVIANAAANRAAASASSSTPATSTGMSSSSASADGDETAMGRRPLQTKSTSLPDFSIVPTLAQHPEPDNNLPQQQLTTTAESMTKADAVS